MATRPLPAAPPPLTDAGLLAALRRGEADALGAAYHRYAPELLLLARRLLGNAAEAEDVVQDLFVGLPEALARYEDRGQLAGWLRTLVARLALMRLRSGRRRRESPLELAPPPAARHPEPTGALTLAALLAALPEAQRLVVVLRAIEGYSHAEVAALLGIRRNAAEVRYHRALARLRELQEDS